MKDLIIIVLVYYVLTHVNTSTAAASSGNSGMISIPNLPDDGFLVISAGYGYNNPADPRSTTPQNVGAGYGTGITGQPGITPPGAIS